MTNHCRSFRSELLTQFCVVAFLVAMSPLTSGGDWPNLRGPHSNGICHEKFVLSDQPPEILWQVNGPRGNGSIVIADGRAFIFGTGAENLVCLDAASGEQMWSKKDVGEWHGGHTPTVVNHRIYILAYSDGPPKAGCFDVESGDEIWKQVLPEPDGKRHYGHAGSPLVAGELVIFNAGGGVALNRTTGDVVWQHDGLPGLATPVLFQHRNRAALAIFLGDRLVARDLDSGNELWSIPWKTSLAVNAHQPLMFDGKLLINSGYGLNPALFDISGHQPVKLWGWEKDSPGHAYAASILHDGLVYGFFHNALACVDPRDGSVRWKQNGDGSVLLIDNKLVWLSKVGVLQIGPVSSEGWTPTLTARIHSGNWRNNPAYSDGRLFMKNDQGDVICVQVGR